MAQHSTLTGADLHEAKGVDAATAGDILVADGAGSANWGANQVDSIMGICSDSTTQTAPGAATKKEITADTNLIMKGVTHTTGTAVFGILTAGYYQLTVIPQIVTGGGGAGQVETSWEADTGSGYVTVGGSPIIDLFTASDEGTPVCSVWALLSAGDSVRAMWATDSASVNIQPVTSIVGDTIPSAQIYVSLHGT